MLNEYEDDSSDGEYEQREHHDRNINQSYEYDDDEEYDEEQADDYEQAVDYGEYDEEYDNEDSDDNVSDKRGTIYSNDETRTETNSANHRN